MLAGVKKAHLTEQTHHIYTLLIPALTLHGHDSHA